MSKNTPLPEAWTKLDEAAQNELRENVAGLPSRLLDNDTTAKNFDLLVIRAEIALLRADRSFFSLRDRIREIAEQLEQRANIPMIQVELELIQDAQSDDYWQDINAPILEELRKRLRSLIKLIDRQKQPSIYTDFVDEIGVGIQISFFADGTYDAMDVFREKTRAYLVAHENDLTLLKLRSNGPLNDRDFLNLEALLLQEQGATPELLERVKAEIGLGIFIRSLIGLDRAGGEKSL